VIQLATLIEQLVARSIGNGRPGSAPTCYACEIELPEHPETAEMRVVIRQAFIDGMAFSNALADADADA
jgi:hypothetical protein